MVDKRDVVGVDENGNLVGEYHPKSKISDEVVDEIRALHDEGFVGYRTLAKWFDIPRSTVSDIIRCRRRASFISHFRAVRVAKKKEDIL